MHPDSKEEHEAEAFALIAMLPLALMKQLIASGEYLDDCTFARELLKQRRTLFTRYNV
jgi:hypothetical protein